MQQPPFVLQIYQGLFLNLHEHTNSNTTKPILNSPANPTICYLPNLNRTVWYYLDFPPQKSRLFTAQTTELNRQI